MTDSAITPKGYTITTLEGIPAAISRTSADFTYSRTSPYPESASAQFRRTFAHDPLVDVAISKNLYTEILRMIA
jgi:hypothetical protein